MSDEYRPVIPGYQSPEVATSVTAPSTGASGTPAPTSGTADVAKEQAAKVKDTSVDAGKQVAGTVKDEAKNVAGEAKTQAKDLFGQTKSELTEQAGTQQKRVASGLRSISDELHEMADKSESGGTATDLVKQAASRAGGIAGWLDDRDPGSLLDEVTRFARQRPGTFIAIAAAAGLVAGRLTSSLVSKAKDDKADASPNVAASGTSDAGAAHLASPSTYAEPLAPAAGFDDGTFGIDDTEVISVDSVPESDGRRLPDEGYRL